MGGGGGVGFASAPGCSIVLVKGAFRRCKYRYVGHNCEVLRPCNACPNVLYAFLSAAVSRGAGRVPFQNGTYRLAHSGALRLSAILDMAPAPAVTALTRCCVLGATGRSATTTATMCALPLCLFMPANMPACLRLLTGCLYSDMQTYQRAELKSERGLLTRSRCAGDLRRRGRQAGPAAAVRCAPSFYSTSCRVQTWCGAML